MQSTRIIHCSDLHFGHGFLPERAERFVDQINEQKPDGVIVSGDLTMRARPSQFKAAREFLQRIQAPLLVIPGNHDVPLYDVYKRITKPFFNYHRYTKDLGTNPLALPHVAFLGLNTVNPRRHQQGRVVLSQLQEIRQWSRVQAVGVWKIVVIHQHLANVTGHERPGVIPDAESVVQAMSEAGIHAVLHGHTHYNNISSSAELFPKVKRPLAIVCVGTATSERLRGHTPANNYNILEFDSRQFLVSQCDWSRQANNFAVCRQVPFDKAFFGSH